jgi:hypothetical protein
MCPSDAHVCCAWCVVLPRSSLLVSFLNAYMWGDVHSHGCLHVTPKKTLNAFPRNLGSGAYIKECWNNFILMYICPTWPCLTWSYNKTVDFATNGSQLSFVWRWIWPCVVPQKITHYSTETTTSAFRVEDGGNILFRSAGIHLQSYTMFQNRKSQPELSPLRKSQNVCKGRFFLWFWYLHGNGKCIMWKRHKLTSVVSVRYHANPDQKSYCVWEIARV